MRLDASRREMNIAGRACSSRGTLRAGCEWPGFCHPQRTIPMIVWCPALRGDGTGVLAALDVESRSTAWLLRSCAASHRAVVVPVIAAGGIADGQGFAAAFVLDAAAV